MVFDLNKEYEIYDVSMDKVKHWKFIEDLIEFIVLNEEDNCERVKIDYENQLVFTFNDNDTGESRKYTFSELIEFYDYKVTLK